MNQTIRKHLRTSVLLGAGAVAASSMAYWVNAAQGATQVETIDVDFGEQVPHAATAAAATPTSDLQGQFVFLLVLTALGMVGIVGILRDFRRSHAHAH